MANVTVLKEEEKFDLNPDATIHVGEIGEHKHKVIVIDDFYATPDEIRYLAESTPYTTDPTVIFDGGIARLEIKLSLEHIREMLGKIIQQVYGFRIYDQPLPFTVNAYQAGAVPKFKVTMAHADTASFGFVLYLNGGDECDGGTSFWRHKETGLESLPLTESSVGAISEDELKKIASVVGEENVYANNVFTNTLFKNHNPNKLVDEQDDWEMVDMVPMKYNRLVLYPSSMFHAPHITEGMYTREWRINQVGMFD